MEFASSSCNIPNNGRKFERKTHIGLDWNYSVATIYLAGWSSPVAREAHNLEVVGSNPAPATSLFG
jgi:hypothetical protein